MSIESYARKELDPVGTTKIMNDGSSRWSGGADNPERTENYSDNNNKKPSFGGDLSFVDASGISGFTTRLGLNGNDMSEMIKVAGLIINHAAGHFCGLNHTGEGTNIQSTSMHEPEGLKNVIRDFGYKAIFSFIHLVTKKDVNEDYKQAMGRRFKAFEKPEDNYSERSKS